MTKGRVLWCEIVVVGLVGLLVAVSPGSAACVDQGDIESVLDGLRGLSFDDFIDESYKAVLINYPNPEEKDRLVAAVS